MHNHEKRALSPPEHGRQRSQTEIQWGRRGDGQWTSSPSTPRESVHCEAHSTPSEPPVNQSSQLPSTTSRHRARLAQDRKHVTKRLTLPSVSSRQSGLRTETWPDSHQILSINQPETSCEMKKQKVQMWQVCLDLQKSIEDCASLRFTAWSVHGHRHCRPSEAQLHFCPSSTHKDRWRDTFSCLNITFPVLCSSSRHSRTPPLAFSESEFRRERRVCRDAHIWCSVVSRRPSGRGLGKTEQSGSKL